MSKLKNLLICVLMSDFIVKKGCLENKDLRRTQDLKTKTPHFFIYFFFGGGGEGDNVPEN